MTSRPLVSIVTISFNQGRFLERAIRSVLEQDYPDVEYIVVDPGSTDGSREIIERYRARIAHVILDPDEGPADGLNRGFSLATGEIYGFLNSDDILLPGAVKKAAAYLKGHPATDVVSAHSLIIDQHDKAIRRGFSEHFSLRRYAYGCVVLMQPSTFFRREAFRKAGGFNAANRSNWDGELWVDMALQGAKFSLVNDFWSGFRLHPQSITSSKRLVDLYREDERRIFSRIVGREKKYIDRILMFVFRYYKHLSHPRASLERVTRGPIYGRR